MSKRAPSPLLRQLDWLYNTISHPFTFLFVVFVVIGWFVAGYLMHFDEHWYKLFHLFEITIALLMVFLIEHSTHTDNKAIQEKLDELIKKIPAADNNMVGLEKKLKGKSS